MISSSLQVEDFFFPEQRVLANPQFDHNGNKQGTVLNVHAKVKDLSGDAGKKFGVDLVVETDDEKSDNPSYSFRLHGFLIFAVADGMASEAEKWRETAKVNGVMMIVGAMRERLADLTSRGPWGKFILPAINLNGGATKE